MMTFKPLEFWHKKYSFNQGESFAEGTRGQIYKIPDGKVVKILHNPENKLLRNDRTAQFQLFREYKNQQLAVDLGLNYPAVKGIFSVRENKSGKYYPGLVMDYIKGITLDKLSGESLKISCKKMAEEKEKAKQLGIIILDNYLGNYALCGKEIYFLDAEKLQIT